MGQFTRDEIEEAFAAYQQAAATAGATGDWRAWADIFTEDASYRMSPYKEPARGLAAIGALWERERVGPSEEFSMSHAIIAVDRETAVARVEVGAPADVPPLRRRLDDAGIECFEADLRFAYRYLIDRDIRGSFRVDGAFTRLPGVDTALALQVEQHRLPLPGLLPCALLERASAGVRLDAAAQAAVAAPPARLRAHVADLSRGAAAREEAAVDDDAADHGRRRSPIGLQVECNHSSDVG